MLDIRDIGPAEYDKLSVVNYWIESTGKTKVALYCDGGTEDFFGEVRATLIFKPTKKNDGKSVGNYR